MGFFHFGAQGKSSRLVVGWNINWSNVDIDVHDAVIHVTMFSLEMNTQICLLNVYGPSTYRKEYWQGLLSYLGWLNSQSLIMGWDLNLVMHSYEVWGSYGRISIME
uniref:Endonuclease/exonuclease/phosphatase domain-containing protein n=1 Tax=Picea glauca TaxID=3330 RepID=A0A101M4P0_PICGL|nr:hypothetical protein ABT39_MTgene872 [Picea glauca]